MYYDTYRGKTRKKQKRKGGCFAWLIGRLLRLLIFLIVLALLAAGALYALPVGLMNIEPANADLSLTDGLPGNRVNVLLLGLDFLNEGQQRSDAMILASIGRDGVKLCSLMRDTMVEIPGHGRHKLNSAYSYGGAEMVMRVINETFQLNITNYIALDLRTLVDVIDAVGGVEVNVKESELEQLNKYAWNTYVRICQIEPEKYARYQNSQPIAQAGIMRLNGLFATSYARIRHSDSDYMRAARQREVFAAIFKSIRENIAHPKMYLQLWNVMQSSISTNLSIPELISLGEKILISGEIDTARIPMNEHAQDDGSSIKITQIDACRRALHEFIYSDFASQAAS